MSYEVFTTEKAVSDLKSIYEYIAYGLCSGQSAIGQLERLERAINSLTEMPERNHRYAKEPWKRRDLRIMPVDNYLIFYSVDKQEKKVTVIRVMYGRRNIDAQLGASEDG